MINPNTAKLLSELEKTSYGKALRELLDEKYAELSNVRNCTSWDDTLGRQHAIKVLEEIFYFMRERVDTVKKVSYE